MPDLQGLVKEGLISFNILWLVSQEMILLVPAVLGDVETNTAYLS